jgi:hypothetical protein
MIITTFLYFQIGSGMFVLSRNRKTFKRLGICERSNSTERFAGMKNMQKKFKNFMPSLGSENQIRTERKEIISPLLGHAAADNEG